MKRSLALSFAVLLQTSFAIAIDETASADQKNSGAGANETRIECTTPDGRVVEIAGASEQNRDAATLQNDVLRCPLQQGETTFVIKVSSATLLDRLTFINENAAAAGHLKISVSNDPLPAASPKWVDVDGNVAFKKKRRFNLSMVGVEARYVKLSFQIDKAERIAAVGF